MKTRTKKLRVTTFAVTVKHAPEASRRNMAKDIERMLRDNQDVRAAKAKVERQRHYFEKEIDLNYYRGE